MVDKNTFTKMAKKVLRPQQGMGGFRAIAPDRDWLIGLVIASIVFIASVVLATYEYNSYRDITVTDYTASEEMVIYRENMVKDALDKFTQRADEHQSLLNQIGVAKVEEVITPSETSEEPTTEATPEVMPEIEDDTVVMEEENTDEVPLIVE